MTKRIFDLVLTLAMLPVLLPVLLVIAVLIRLTDGAPVFFLQQRVGLGGRDFQIFKFRTMRNKPQSAQGSFDAGDSSRVTPLGRLLRASKLDELPQLFNVLRGEMSLVGPRPEVRNWVQVYPVRWAVVHEVRPGITDPASIEFRHEEELLSQSADPQRTYREVVLPRKLYLYEEYVDRRSFFGDLGILFRTLLAVLPLRRSQPQLPAEKQIAPDRQSKAG